ncbi:MAG: hypothetical protein ABI811_23375 [Acidobacteriota bacterium]
MPPEFNGEVNPNVEIIAGLPTLPAPPPAPATTKPLPPAPPKQQATVEVNPPPVVVSPKPAAIISAAERQVLTRELDDKTGRVRTALARVQGRRLSSDLQTLATQAQTFLTQAESARTAQDLVTAVSLARTAANFAAELIDRLP